MSRGDIIVWADHARGIPDQVMNSSFIFISQEPVLVLNYFIDEVQVPVVARYQGSCQQWQRVST